MTIHPLAIPIRAKKLGVLIRDSRTNREKSIEACAKALNVSEETFTAYEMGEKSPSLPELELLAYTLELPLEHFWGNQAVSSEGTATPKIDVDRLIGLRQRIIGVMLRKARQEAGMSYETLAERSGVADTKLNAYELGQIPIPLPELEVLTTLLNASIREYQDKHGPIGNWFITQRAIQDFKDLPLDLQTFVSRPVNRPYLELAVRLSEMSVDKLRAVAEGLLEITL